MECQGHELPVVCTPGIRSDQSDWHDLIEHLNAVASDGMKLAEQALPGNSILRDQAQICGYWHDIGKFRQGFQDYLRGISVQAQLRYHKQAGALLLRQQSQIMASFVIAGHHGGIPNLAALQEM
jgi:CRISPR-associated endonuclease/helicase Cas3